ncbi:MAG: helix-turn-helix transcriptional regulator, partial [Eubacteriales bacterium]
TQEEFAEIVNMSNRTISRWENGNSMPDIDILIEISEFYNVDIRELLDGERKSENMDKDLEETVIKVAEYDNEEKLKMLKKISRFSVVGICTMIIYLILLFVDPNETPFNDFISGLMLGVSLATIIISAIFTSKYGAKIRAFKLRTLEKVR